MQEDGSEVGQILWVDTAKLTSFLEISDNVKHPGLSCLGSVPFQQQ
jgi:hypothetical protein